MSDSKFGLILPTSGEILEERENFISKSFKPLHTGFGVTLGNSLRRVLLSSIKGVAITHVNIEKIYHICTSVIGVKEDIMHILPALQNIIFSMNTSAQKVTLSVKGKCDVYASMINHSNSVEILNPDLYICSLDEDGELHIEILLQKGFGYVESASMPAEVIMGTNTLALDNISFSPIKRVGFEVLPMRVGLHINYDNLILDVETNGAINPSDAISEAAKILSEQFLSIADGDINDNLIENEKPSSIDISMNNRLYDLVDSMPLSPRARRCLRALKIIHIGDLVTTTKEELSKVTQCGVVTLEEIQSRLYESYGFSLGMKIDWPINKESSKIMRGGE